MFGLKRGSWRTAVVASLSVTACLLFVSAAGAGIRNGGFEEGNFQGWTVADKGEAGSWFVYSGTATPLNSIPVVAPPEGTFAAVTDQFGPGAHVLYQTLKLGTESAQVLSFNLYYRNTGIVFCTPLSLDFTGEEGCNQQYRVDILRKGSDPFSVSSNDVLRTLFRTEVGDPLTLGPTPMSFKLTHLHGKVILRFAEVDNVGPFHASVDDVTLQSA